MKDWSRYISDTYICNCALLMAGTWYIPSLFTVTVSRPNPSRRASVRCRLQLHRASPRWRSFKLFCHIAHVNFGQIAFRSVADFTVRVNWLVFICAVVTILNRTSGLMNEKYNHHKFIITKLHNFFSMSIDLWIFNITLLVSKFFGVFLQNNQICTCDPLFTPTDYYSEVSMDANGRDCSWSWSGWSLPRYSSRFRSASPTHPMVCSCKCHWHIRVRAGGGGLGGEYRFNFFHVVFREKKGQIIGRRSTLGVAPPRLGNPGPATDCCKHFY